MRLALARVCDSEAASDEGLPRLFFMFTAKRSASAELDRSRSDHSAPCPIPLRETTAAADAEARWPFTPVEPATSLQERTPYEGR